MTEQRYVQAFAFKAKIMDVAHLMSLAHEDGFDPTPVAAKTIRVIAIAGAENSGVHKVAADHALLIFEKYVLENMEEKDALDKLEALES